MSDRGGVAKLSRAEQTRLAVSVPSVVAPKLYAPHSRCVFPVEVHGGIGIQNIKDSGGDPTSQFYLKKRFVGYAMYRGAASIDRTNEIAKLGQKLFAPAKTQIGVSSAMLPRNFTNRAIPVHHASPCVGVGLKTARECGRSTLLRNYAKLGQVIDESRGANGYDHQFPVCAAWVFFGRYARDRMCAAYKFAEFPDVRFINYRETKRHVGAGDGDVSVSEKETGPIGRRLCDLGEGGFVDAVPSTGSASADTAESCCSENSDEADTEFASNVFRTATFFVGTNGVRQQLWWESPPLNRQFFCVPDHER